VERNAKDKASGFAVVLPRERAGVVVQLGKAKAPQGATAKPNTTQPLKTQFIHYNTTIQESSRLNFGYLEYSL
jgi:hypothetical protein